MVAAREEFLGAGHLAPVADAIAAAALDALGERAGTAGCVVDLGAGTGYQLARVLDSLPGWLGLALDASTPALRRAVRAHARIAAVACDVWGELPLRDGAADLALNVFAPRSGSEIARVLAPRGALIVVTPTPRHLRELAGLPGMLSVDEQKAQRLEAKLSPWLDSVVGSELELDLSLSRSDARRLVAMGPSAHHTDTDQIEPQLDAMTEPLAVTASVTVETFRKSERPESLDPSGPGRVRRA
jgi:23S rRNA (guanine745-N1)-methyltransferase